MAKQIKIRTNDGAEFKGRNERAVVRAMKHDQWAAPDTKGEYMQEVSEVLARSSNMAVRYDTAENFLSDLAANGLIEFLD